MEKSVIWKREESSGNGARVRRLAVFSEWGEEMVFTSRLGRVLAVRMKRAVFRTTLASVG